MILDALDQRYKGAAQAAGDTFSGSVDKARESVRHVKGSHIVVPRVHAEPHAYILQNADNRIVFVIPYERDFSLIGTTDIPVESGEKPVCSPEEIDYLAEGANAETFAIVAGARATTPASSTPPAAWMKGAWKCRPRPSQPDPMA